MTDPDPRMATPQDRIWLTLQFIATSILAAQKQLRLALGEVHTAMETSTPYAGKDGTYRSIFTDPTDMQEALTWINDETAQAQVELAAIPREVLSIRNELTQIEKKEPENVSE